MSPLRETTVTTAKGASVRVHEAGDGAPLVFMHDVTGLLDARSFLEPLSERYHVVAPELPGYGASTGEELLEDMLDFALHGWDVVAALGLERPLLVGHGMGGMIAAEMAAVSPTAADRLVLVAPLGLWADHLPIPDLFSLLPYELPRVLFADPDAGAPLLVTRGDFTDLGALQDFFIGNARRLGTAGKILFPIPNRRIAKRLYRVSLPTLLLWGERDLLVDPAYAGRWQALLPDGRVEIIAGAGHMLPYEQPAGFLAALDAFVESAPVRT